jgi:hypothetical protein
MGEHTAKTAAEDAPRDEHSSTTPQMLLLSDVAAFRTRAMREINLREEAALSTGLIQYLRQTYPQLLISKRKLRQATTIELVRRRRADAQPSLGFASRPFVLCGLPIKKPNRGELLHERRNGHFVLQVTGHPSYGLPWGQDRLVPIFLATLAIRQHSQVIKFKSAAEMLDLFGMQQGGTQYRRLIGAFQQIFGATIFFGDRYTV